MEPDLNLTTSVFGDAFDALSTEWAAFELQEGSGTKEGANKRLVATKDAIPEALWEFYEADTNRKATEDDTVGESSDHMNESH